MADVTVAIAYVLRFEDECLTGVISVEPGGERVRFGINERWHPELTASLFYTSMGATPALEIADAIYRTSYCEPLCIEEIANQPIANKLLSLGVNIGIVPASKLLQDAIPVGGCDGHIGPITLHHLESMEPGGVLQRLKEDAENFYCDVYAKDPEKYKNVIDGWLRRARA